VTLRSSDGSVIISGPLLRFDGKGYSFHRAGIYTGRIPGREASRSAGRAGFINMKRARTLGLNVPPTVLATSDQAIE